MTLEYHPLFATDLLEAARYLANEDSLLGFEFIKKSNRQSSKSKSIPFFFQRSIRRFDASG